MTVLLPAVIPEIPETRADVVPARVARKLAPLLGVRSEHAPFPLTWVCDFGSLTVSEIARGAPSPTRSEQDRASSTPGQWTQVGRTIAGHRVGAGRPDPLPNEIANATVNRFGPDTKAALVLTGANVLLRPVTKAIIDALSFLESHSDGTTTPAQGLAEWTALILDVFRSQPALVTAALQASAVQQANFLDWDVERKSASDWARSERAVLFSKPGESDSKVLPIDLELVTTTLSILPIVEGPGGPARRTALIALLSARLRNLGRADSDGYLWLTERTPGHRSVDAFVPFDPFVSDFVAAALDHHDDGAEPRLPGIPSVAAVSALPELTRRCVVLALGVRLRLAFSSGNPDPFADLSTLATLEALDALVVAILPRDDPARVTVRCRVADMRLEIVRQDVTYDSELPAAVAALTEAVEHALRLARHGGIGAGDAAELAFSGNVELLATLRRHRTSPIAGLPPVSAFEGSVRKSWRTAFSVLGIDQPTGASAGLDRQGLGFHVHNFATYLGREAEIELEAAGHRLFHEVVLPARRRYHQRTGNFRPLLYTLQNATAAGVGLAQRWEANGDHPTADRYLLASRALIDEALAEPFTRNLIEAASAADASDEATRFALLAVPALLRVLERSLSPDAAGDVAAAERLLAVAELFAERFGKIGGRYSRADEIAAARARLTSYLASGTGPVS